MRVLHLDSGGEMRGGQVQALRLIEGLRGRGVECRLLARAGSPFLAEAERRGWSAGAIGLASTALESRRHDLVHAHDARAHTLAAISLAAIPGAPPLVVSRRVAFRIRSSWKYRRAARYIAVSRYVAEVLREGGVPRDRIAVVYDGVPLLPDAPQRQGVLAPSNATDPRKGASVAVEAARLAGVEIVFSDNLERDLPGAAIFVYITYSEGLGSGALLAMAAGAAVIASRVGGLPEAIHDEVTGLLVESEPRAVAAALRRLAGRPDLVRSLGAKARETVAEQFSIERMVEGTMGVYRQVLQ